MRRGTGLSAGVMIAVAGLTTSQRTQSAGRLVVKETPQEKAERERNVWNEEVEAKKRAKKRAKKGGPR